MALKIRILGTGAYLPRRAVASNEIDARLGERAGWTARHYGIETRHVAAPDETTSFMAARAAADALAAAGLAPAELDCIVGACGVMEQPIPGTAILVQERLGLGASGIPAFDVNATCLGFVTALDLVGLAVAAGRFRRVLIVSSDIASAGLDWHAPEAAAIFGDGAAAAIVGPSAAGESSALLAAALESFGVEKDACVLAAGGTRLRPRDDLPSFLDATLFRMDGKAAFRAAQRHMPPFWLRLLAEAGVSTDDLALIIPHQASGSALQLIPRRLGVDAAKVFNVFGEVGNMIAASIPYGLHRALAEGRIGRGDRIALVGTAAGISLGGVVLEL